MSTTPGPEQPIATPDAGPGDGTTDPQATARPATFVCPYCGGSTPDQPRCPHCRGLMDPLSRQATQNTMGPWFVRDEASPYRPGCSHSILVQLVARGKIGPDTILRGPTTHQFWMPARRTPGVAHLLGMCHACGVRASPASSSCAGCGVSFKPADDRQALGLGPIRLLPGQAPPEMVATSTVAHPTPEPARGPSSIGPRPGDEPEPGDSARIGTVLSLRHQVATLWSAFIVTLIVLVLVVAVFAGAWLGGFVRLNTTPAGPRAVDSGTPRPAGAVTDPRPAPASNPPMPASEGRGPELQEPDPDVTSGPDQSSADPGPIERARALLLEDTPASLSRAMELLAPRAGDPDAGVLLERVRLRLEQRSIPGPGR
ncbi:MAG: hypothetical protein HRU70_09790 [Phycisphaeraceae bacterium]|nr:MAG: hypothetical protein HRU70_09790 [Phycisphaeraceae bacterium]